MNSGALSSAAYVTYLQCPKCNEIHESSTIQTVCISCGSPLLVMYDLESAQSELKRSLLVSRLPDMWRYRELLPVQDLGNVVSLGETMTPVVHCRTVGAGLGMDHLFVKDEGRLPTASFKARGLAMAVTMANEFGIRRVTIPTAGNAGGALAAYGARAGMEVFVFCPEDAPEINANECGMVGAAVYLVNGLIDDCGRIVREGKDLLGWFDMSTLREPYRIEGKKTMGLETAEQFSWDLPDAIFYPTGGGTGLIGMWKAFNELETLGWIGSKRPRLISVQSEGCAPIVRAFEEGAETARPWEHASTVAAGIRVPHCIGDFLILRAIRETNGTAIAVPDDEILLAQRELAEKEGIIAAPEGAATLAALKKALDRKDVDKDERVLLFNTGSGLKYPMNTTLSRIDKDKPVDYAAMLRR
ncbi:MAG: threonine synthase [Desulfomonilaceae bacterium]|nr:threonine synthase [Desulfomonilaceae bacterium]